MSDTRYPLGSLTSLFVATTVAQLVGNDLLKRHAPVATYILELSCDSDPSLPGQLTLVDLLSHSAGLARSDAPWIGANSQVNMHKNEAVRVCNHPLPARRHRPGFLYK